MVSAIKKSSSSSVAAAAAAAAAAEVVAGGIPPLRRRSAGKRSAEKDGGTKSRSPNPKKKKRIEKKDTDTEMVDDDTALHIYDYARAKKVLPEESKTLFATNVRCPEGRKIVQADFVKFFKKAGKVVNVQITFDKENEQYVDLAEIEFESYNVAEKALRKLDQRRWFGTIVNLDVSPEGSGEKYDRTDCTYQRHVIYIDFGKPFKCDGLSTKLEEHFSSCGGISWIKIRDQQDGTSGLSTGYAYIEFKDADSFSRALALNGRRFMGAPLLVRRAKVLVSSA